ncbi:probable glutamate receptor, partial [Penaeus japonicus]|uniref:probable glutamate receptor n=1 Tax=Penaeus japonicus TaxID=27405 RepID=UPI001C714FE5
MYKNADVDCSATIRELLITLRELSWCVSVVVVSDSPAFLTTFAVRSLESQFLVWSTRLLLVTHLGLQEVSHLHEALSMMNAMLMTFHHDQGLTSCTFYVYMPYSPAGEEAVQVASWASRRGLVLREDFRLFPQKLRHRAEIVVAAEEYPPHAFVLLLGGTDSQGRPRFSITGPMVKLLDIMASSVNFTYTYIRPPDGAWGAKQPDGSFSGMVGMLSRKEADLGLGPFGMSASRAEVVDYTGFIVIDYARIIGGRGRAEVDPWGFLLPLAPEVWLGVAVMTAMAMVTVALLTALSERVSAGRRSTGLVFGVVRVLLIQDLKVASGRRWERVLLAGWMIVTLVTVKSYAGNLMSLLAVRHIPQPYQSVRDVLDDTSCTMIWEANTAYVQFVESVSSGIFHEVSQAGKEGRILYRKTTEHLDTINSLVRSGPNVLILEDLTHKFLMGQDFSVTGRCDFYTSREMFLPFIFAMIGQKSHPLVPALSKR